MNDLKKEKINELMQLVSKHLNIIRKYGLSQMQFWIIALCIGVASGLATLGFRLAIKYLQLFFYGESGVSLTSAVSELPWFTIITIPIDCHLGHQDNIHFPLAHPFDVKQQISTVFFFQSLTKREAHPFG